MFNVENPEREKPRESTDSKLSLYHNDYNSELTEATTSCSRSSPQAAVTTEATTSSSLSLSLYTVTRYNLAQTRMTTTPNKFALSHIYTNMTFRLFTNIASMNSQKTYLRICPFIR